MPVRSASPPLVSRRILAAQVVAYVVGLLIVAPTEIARARELAAAGAGPLGWLFGMGLDSTLFFVLLLAAPVLWFWRSSPAAKEAQTRARQGAWFGTSTRPGGTSASLPDWRAWVLSLAVGVLSLAVSTWIANQRVGGQLNLRFGDLPPAYHDEFSYRFQAQTFLAGRLSFPSHPTAPELFDQMHVVNEGRFASRYFPGAGAWIAPFLALGHPYWGQWLAGALAAIFTFWAGRELAGNGVGLLAGGLLALSPGVGLFSNLLLAHHPTLLGLSLFLYAFLRLQRTGCRLDALFCGCGLAFAMLCRPMTAAGVGLPFGLWHLWWLVRGPAGSEPTPTADSAQRNTARAEDRRNTSFRERAALTAMLAAPLVAGLLVMAYYNRVITGSAWVSPYQLYTETYTPRHAYGFNNVKRGEQHLGPKVIDNYDRWAENLTPGLAVKNTRDRLLAAWQWTLSIPMLAMACIMFAGLLRGRDRRWWLVPAAAISLFVVHVPYWFVGIMNWHYVFESAPLWLLMFAGATQWLFEAWRSAGRRVLPVWWGACVAVTVAVTFTSDDATHLKSAVNEVAFSRVKYEQFRQTIDKLVVPRPALVLVEADPADRSIDYVVNDPDLKTEVLVGRYRPKATNLAHIVELFPERTCWLFRVKEGSLIRVAVSAHSSDAEEKGAQKKTDSSH